MQPIASGLAGKVSRVNNAELESLEAAEIGVCQQWGSRDGKFRWRARVRILSTHPLSSPRLRASSSPNALSGKHCQNGAAVAALTPRVAAASKGGHPSQSCPELQMKTKDMASSDSEQEQATPVDEQEATENIAEFTPVVPQVQARRAAAVARSLASTTTSHATPRPKRKTPSETITVATQNAKQAKKAADRMWSGGPSMVAREFATRFTNKFKF
ncbi:hypothetical protein GGX14DRAFT_397672 [Mycena pura]|uniref:Uncharacterized protein n=1 Tax=Mycena pura TaxID=153505 RepID=A0AAD6VFC7_9AGAR|nr:hypothetical protein GGX14DRAFT_397672 [Mycena pura]